MVYIILYIYFNCIDPLPIFFQIRYLPSIPGEVVRLDHNWIVRYGILYNFTLVGSDSGNISDTLLKNTIFGISFASIASLINRKPSNNIILFFSLNFFVLIFNIRELKFIKYIIYNTIVIYI